MKQPDRLSTHPGWLRRLPGALLPAMVGVALLFVSLAWESDPSLPVDDAYISFRYAESWANGEGLVFNSGERVEGYSNFLFVALLTVGSKLGLSPPLTARLVNLISLLCVLALLSLALRSWALRLWACVVFGGARLTALNVLSGLEAPLAAGLLLGGALALAVGPVVAAPVIFLGLALLRPEGVVLAAVAAVLHVSSVPSKKAVLVGWVVCFAAPYLAFLGWRWFYYGDWLPNSVRAKQGWPLGEIARRSLVYLGEALPFCAPLLILIVWALWSRRKGLGGPLERVAGALAATLALICLVIGAGDPYTSFVRYLFPALPLVLLLAARSAAVLVAPPIGGLARAGVAALLLLPLGLGAARPGPTSVAQKPVARLAVGFDEIFRQDTSPHHYRPGRDLFLGHHELAAWLLENAKGESETLATSEIGIAAYYSGLRVLDTAALVEPAFARQPGWPGAKGTADEVYRQRPDYLAFRKSPRLGSGLPIDVEVLRDPRLGREHDFIKAFSGGRWRLLLFRRREQPLYEVASDLLGSFGLERVAFLDAGELRRDPELAAKAVSSHERFRLLGEEGEERLLEQLAPALSGVEEPRAPALMRRWLGRRQGVILHRPLPGKGDPIIAYDLQVPPRAELRFGLLMAPRGAGAPPFGNAVTYRIEAVPTNVAPRVIFSRTLDPRREPEDRGWHEERVDLGSFAGQDVELRLRASPGPESTGIHGRGGWVRPLLVIAPQARPDAKVGY